MIIVQCTKCDKTAQLKIHIENNGDMIIECLGCGDMKKFKTQKLNDRFRD